MEQNSTALTSSMLLIQEGDRHTSQLSRRVFPSSIFFAFFASVSLAQKPVPFKAFQMKETNHVIPHTPHTNLIINFWLYAFCQLERTLCYPRVLSEFFELVASFHVPLQKWMCNILEYVKKKSSHDDD